MVATPETPRSEKPELARRQMCAVYLAHIEAAVVAISTQTLEAGLRRLDATRESRYEPVETLVAEDITWDDFRYALTDILELMVKELKEGT